MAESLEFEIKVSGDDAVRQLRKTGDELKRLGSGADGAAKSISTFGANLGGYVVAAQAAIRAFTQLAAGVKAFADEVDRRSNVLDAFGGSVAEAQRRTSGLVSQLDLMVASNRAAQTGLQLSERSLANIAVAATKYAEATGDATVTTEDLARAIANGEERSLRKFGISLEGVTGRANKQREALEQLEAIYGDQSAEADSLADAFQQLDIAVDDATTGFSDAITASTDLQRAISDLGTALAVDLPSGFDIGTAAGESFAAMLGLLADGLTEMIKAIQALSDGDWAAALSSAQRSLGMIGEATVGNILAAATGNPAFNNQFTERVSSNRADTQSARAARAGRTATPGRGGGGGRGGRSRAPDVDFSAQFGAMANELGIGTRIQLGAGDAVDLEQNAIDLAVERTGRQQKAIDDLNEARRRGIELENESAEAQADAANEAIAQLEERRKLTEAVFSLAEQGAEAAFEIFRIAEGPQEAVRAAIEAARAFASYPDPIGIASHTIAAISHAANAAQLGFGTSVKTPNAGAARAVPPTNGGGGGDGGTTVINYNAPVAEALIGREQRRAQRAADRQLARA